MEAEKLYRYRLRFSKTGLVKYVGHLDTVIAWTRAFRRVGIPLAYSHGFNPQARIQVAASLPLGYISSAELMDIYLIETVDAAETMVAINSTLPSGFALHQFDSTPVDAPKLQNHLIEAEYEVRVETILSEAFLQNRIREILQKASLETTRIRKRREERFDLRPLLHDLALKQLSKGDALLHLRVAAGSNGNLRPENVLTVLGLKDIWFEIRRTRLIFSFDKQA